MSKKFSFSSTEDEALITLVENNKCIYDSSHKQHKDNYVKDNIWKNISGEVGRSIDDCRKRWKNIRDTYLKQKKKLPTGSAAPHKKPRYTMNLSFLDTFEYERSTITNMGINDADTSNASTTDEIEPEVQQIIQNDEEQTENIVSDLPSGSYAGKRIRSKDDKISVILAKRPKETKDTILCIQEQNKLLATSMKNLCEEDEIDIFFKSIAMTVKKMPQQAIKEVKLKTLTLITEIDDKYSTRPTLPYQIPPDYNNMYQLSSPASSYSTSTSTSQGFLPFNYGDESNG
ncbi:uncharacterized protein LOC126553509 [Aphis gossypii]|uniref:uncharacterized protein LOC126553509 n=1 Tax=Aphis gossypii TaxID=80765 RepID=UPI0021594230|nr:uncharacterized protein LOC126553509 [Aphis gossypii]